MDALAGRVQLHIRLGVPKGKNAIEKIGPKSGRAINQFEEVFPEGMELPEAMQRLDLLKTCAARVGISGLLWGWNPEFVRWLEGMWKLGIQREFKVKVSTKPYIEGLIEGLEK